MLQYRGQGYSLAYPDNWAPLTGQNGPGVTIAPPSGVQESNQMAVGYGAIVNLYQPKLSNASPWQATDELLSAMKAGDPRLRAARDMPKEISVGGKRAIVVSLSSDSIFQGQAEIDTLVAVPHPNGILYVVLVAPESEAQYANRAFDQMLQSMRFTF
jgi:hypothetical protein